MKKKDEYYYGYKKHVATDLNGLVISVHTTPANVSDITEFKPLMEKTKVARQVRVYADKGYPSAANRAVLKEKKLKDGIM